MGNKGVSYRLYQLHAPDTTLINNDGEKLISLACNFQLTRSRYVFPFHCDFHLFSFFFSFASISFSLMFLLVSCDGKFPVSYSIVRRATTNVSLRYIRCTAIMIATHHKQTDFHGKKMMLNASWWRRKKNSETVINWGTQLFGRCQRDLIESNRIPLTPTNASLCIFPLIAAVNAHVCGFSISPQYVCQ